MYEDGKLCAMLEEESGTVEEVTECGPCCSCTAQCWGRLTQQGLAHRVHIIHSDCKGWAAHAVEAIAKGSFVCQVRQEALPCRLPKECIA